MESALATYLSDYSLGSAAHVYTAACMLVFALGLQQLPSRRAVRAAWGFTMSTFYLGTQPLIYATRTQPQSVALASLAMMVSWTLLDWGLLQPSNSCPSTSEVCKSLFKHVMYGVSKVHKRRSEPREPQGAIPATNHAMDAAEGNLKQHRGKQQQATKPVFHISASGSCASPANTVPAAVPTAGVIRQPSSRAASGPEILLSNDFAGSTTVLADATSNAITLKMDAVLQAVWVLAQLVVTYDVGYAVLCCISGNMWKAAADEQQMDHGLLGVLLGPNAAYYIFHYGVSCLLPLQMGIADASLRLGIVLMGQSELASSLPMEAFNSPTLSTSISDLWGNRWHQFLRYYFQGLGYALVDKTVRPVLQLLPVQQQKSVLATARSLVVFAMSGVWHEYITWAAWGVVTGKYMAFFLMHGLAVIVEGVAVRLVPKHIQAGIPYWFKRVYATAFMVLTAPLFTAPYRQHGYLEHCYHPFVVPITLSVARWAGFCAC
eukprot:GHUV01007888.1.p1 GENE.GHUV01007888.1~~GHUV01007888.1.p1  ORF type:complete len:490 (+),score=83.66 GHUV01007888.1:1090-2559(+)